MLDVVRKERSPEEVATNVGVTSEVEADWREFAGYLIKFQFQDVLKLIVRELDIPRAAEELDVELTDSTEVPAQRARQSRASRYILDLQSQCLR